MMMMMIRMMMVKLFKPNITWCRDVTKEVREKQGSHFSSKMEFPDFSLTSKMKFQVSG